MAATTRQSRVWTLILTIVTILISIPARAEDPSPWINPQTVDIGKGQAEAQAISVGYDYIEQNKELQLKIQMSPAYGSIKTSNVVQNPGSIWFKVSSEAQEHVFASQGLDSDTTFYAHFEGTLSVKGSGTGTGTGAAGPKPFHVKVADVDLDCDSDNDGDLANDRDPERDDNEDEREAATGAGSANGGGMMLPADTSKWAILKLTLHTRVAGTLDLFNGKPEWVTLAKNKQGDPVANETLNPGTHARTYYVRATAEDAVDTIIIATFTPSGPKGGSKSGRAQDVLLITVGNSLVLDINNTAKVTDDFVPVLAEAPPAGTRRVPMRVRLAPPGVAWSGDYAVTLAVPDGLSVYTANAGGDPITGVTLKDTNSYQAEVWLEAAASTTGEKTITASAEDFNSTAIKAKCVVVELEKLYSVLVGGKVAIRPTAAPEELSIGVPVALAISKVSGTGAAEFASSSDSSATLLTDQWDYVVGKTKSDAADNMLLKASVNGVEVARRNFTIFDATLTQSGDNPQGRARDGDDSWLQWEKAEEGSKVTVTATLEPALTEVPGYVELHGGVEVTDKPLQRTVDRSKLGATTVRLIACASVQDTVVEVVEDLVDYTAGEAPTAKIDCEWSKGMLWPIEREKGCDYVITYGGSAVLKVMDLEDEDGDTDANTYYDTFTNTQAIRWTGARADWNPQFGPTTIWTPTAPHAPDETGWDRRDVMLDLKDDGKYYQDLAAHQQVASLKVHVHKSASLGSIDIKDKGNPTRHHGSLLEIVGIQNVVLKAFKAGGGDWDPDYPMWRITGPAPFNTKTKIGQEEWEVEIPAETVIPKSVLWITGTDLRKYLVEAKGNGNEDWRKMGMITAHPNQPVTWKLSVPENVLSWASTMEKLTWWNGLVKVEVPSRTAAVVVETEWHERVVGPVGDARDQRNEVMMEVDSRGGFFPLIGIEIKIPVWGYSCKYLEGGLWIRFTGNIGGGAAVKRMEAIPPPHWQVGAQVRGKVAGEFGGGIKAGNVLEFELYGGSSVTGTVDFAGDARGFKVCPSLVWDGVYVKVHAQVKLLVVQWEWSKDLFKTKGLDIWSRDYYVLTWGRRI